MCAAVLWARGGAGAAVVADDIGGDGESEDEAFEDALTVGRGGDAGAGKVTTTKTDG